MAGERPLAGVFSIFRTGTEGGGGGARPQEEKEGRKKKKSRLGTETEGK